MLNRNEKRWELFNRNTGVVRRRLATRSAARSAKRPTERIYDRLTGTIVR